MYSIVTTAILQGIEALPVQVEADVSDGLPVFEMVGFLAAEVRESRERVRTALRNCGHTLPAKRITVNLSPANVRKCGNGFDLPITVAVLAALGLLEEHALEGTLIIGEIGLNGAVLAVDGILPIVCRARELGVKTCVIPKGSARGGRGYFCRGKHKSCHGLFFRRIYNGRDICGTACAAGGADAGFCGCGRTENAAPRMRGGGLRDA